MDIDTLGIDREKRALNRENRLISVIERLIRLSAPTGDEAEG